MQILSSRCYRRGLAVVLVLFCALSVGYGQLFPLARTGAKAETASAEVTIRLVPEQPKPGEEATLSIHVVVPAGSHTYSMTTPKGGKTRVKLTRVEGLEALGEFTADHPPKQEFSPEFEGDVEKYTGEVTWTQKYRVLPEAKGIALEGTFNYQVCDDRTCRNLKETIAIGETDSEQSSVAEAPKTRANPPVVTSNAAGLSWEGRLPKRGTQRGQVKVEIVPATAKVGDEVRLEAAVTLDADWHTYSITQPEKNDAEPTVIDVQKHRGLESLDVGFTADRAPEVKVDAARNTRQEVYEGHVTWSRRFRLTEPLEAVHVAGSLVIQICKGSCALSNFEFEIGTPPQETREPGGTANAPPAPPAPKAATPVSSSIDEIIRDVVDVSGGDGASATAPGTDPRAQGLLYFLGGAFLAGFVGLLTPCVFPMVPITISFFLKQSEKQHHRPVSMAFVYCGSIVVTFTILGLVASALFGATSINAWANSVWLNLFLSAVLVFFALNLLGMYEIRIPSSLLTFTAGKESAGGYVGVIFMALTFTLTSFTCTFAFLGLLLVWSAQGEFWWPLLGLIAFSTAFALPFFFLALFPSYLQRLPKTGGWLNSVKVIMGLIELAFVFKFLSVADIGWNGTPRFLDYHAVMSAWMIIAVTAGMYLLGFFRTPHDTPAEHVAVLPLVMAMSFLGFGSYLAVGLFGAERPKGWMWERIAGFAPPQFEGGVDEDGPFLIGRHDRLKYLLDFESALKLAQREHRPLLVDFTGVNCINCRFMEEKMALPQNQKLLKELVRVQLFTDLVPDVAAGFLNEKILEVNRRLQEEWFKDTALPGYAVASPDGKLILGRFVGTEEKPGEFAAFLTIGQTRWRSHQPGTLQAAGPSMIDSNSGLSYWLDLHSAVRQAEKENRPLFVEIISTNDIRSVAAQQRLAADETVRMRLKQMVRARLYVDLAPSPAVTEKMLAGNQTLLENWFQDVALPGLAVVSSDGKSVLAEYIGFERHPGQYADFLDFGLRRWEKTQRLQASARH